MTHQNHSLVLTQRSDAFPENLLGNLCIHSQDGVIQEINVGVCVESPCQYEPCLLASGQGDAPLANNCLIFLRENLEVSFETGQSNSFVVQRLAEFSTEDNILFNGV